MDIFYLVVRILLLTVAFLMATTYVVAQLWQKIPATTLQLKAHDYVVLTLVAFLCGVGFNSYWGLLAFVPILAWRLVAARIIQKNRLQGSGRWMEVQWMKMTPKGFNIPREMMSELQKLPGDTHFIIPRFVSLWAIKYFLKSMRKRTGLGNGANLKLPQNMRGQEAQAFSMLENMANNITRLDAGRTESLNLPFGVLKITRL